MHHAKLKHSPRLRRLLTYLRDQKRNWVSGRDIIAATGVVALSASISEIRKNGYPVACHFQHRTPEGASVYVYRLGKA